MKRKVLIMTAYYTPSIKGGGPIQSVKNIVENLSNIFDFYIVTSDRDLGDENSFPNINTDEWLQVDKAKVYYINPLKLTWIKIAEVINSIDYDVIYLNSFFSYKFSIVPILLYKMKKIKRKTVVVAPRGVFYPGAFNRKIVKKKLFTSIVKVLGLYNDVTWHATTQLEKKQIQEKFGENSKIVIANNLTSNYMELTYEKKLMKEKGELKISFVSRIHPKKNLLKAIQLLEQVKGNIEFNIYGPIEDKEYWNKCECAIRKLPQNINVSYRGVVDHDEIMKVFHDNHIFLFPTLGENYGHVISEALIGGCPVILSDQTPWRNLENENVGWDINLSDEKKFIDIIQYCTNLSHDNYQVLSKKAFEYGRSKSNNVEDLESYLMLFK